MLTNHLLLFLFFPLFLLLFEHIGNLKMHDNVNLLQTELLTEMKDAFISEQINIDCVTREEIGETISQPGPNCFDRAQRLIYGLMENDCYPRFLKSEIYQALLEQQ